jgi:hypothetical protein
MPSTSHATETLSAHCRQGKEVKREKQNTPLDYSHIFTIPLINKGDLNG